MSEIATVRGTLSPELMTSEIVAPEERRRHSAGREGSDGAGREGGSAGNDNAGREGIPSAKNHIFCDFCRKCGAPQPRTQAHPDDGKDSQKLLKPLQTIMGHGRKNIGTSNGVGMSQR